MITKIESLGQIISASSITGDTPNDRRKPAHPGGLQVSKDRWLLFYSTRGFRGGDDDCSIVYQLRQDAPDGPVIKEAALARQTEWAPFDGYEELLAGNTVCIKEHSHCNAFGVPKGARIDGRRVPHENVFAIMWRIAAKTLKLSNNHCHCKEPLFGKSHDAEWMQVRLNDAEDDIEVLAPPRPLRQVGYEDAPSICNIPDGPEVRNQIHTYVPAVPFNNDASEWVHCNNFRPFYVAPLRHRFNPTSGVYEWVETGRCLPQDLELTEPGLLRGKDDWLITTRPTYANRAGGFGAPVWYRLDDLFQGPAQKVSPETPLLTSTPRTAFHCADGQLRLFANAHAYAPMACFRDPLFAWDIDPDTLESTACHEAFNSRKAGLELLIPMMDFAVLLPHAGGREQYLLHRGFVMNNDHDRYLAGNPEKLFLPKVKPHEFNACGVYAEKLIYDDNCPATWEFA